MRDIPKINSLIIKIGSNVLTGSDKALNEERIEKIVETIVQVKKIIPHVAVVSSGAVAAGFKLLGFKERPKAIVDKQASAATGQAQLMWYYEHTLAKHGLHASQILITKYDFSSRTRYLSARSTIRRILELGAVPIINENDAVVVNEIKYVESFGDNDNLSALVAGLIDADMLLILSDVDGLYTANPSEYPNAIKIDTVDKIDGSVLKLASSAGSTVGTGGMRFKLMAAQKALLAGCRVGIINGNHPENILKFLNGEPVGTYFNSPVKSSDRKKLWLAYATIPQGKVIVDNGARMALVENHKSLLPKGIVDVQGDFIAGDIVNIVDLSGEVIALGKCRYSSEELSKIKKKHSSEIAGILGRSSSSIVIHSDDMGFA